jgi:hypothetical protein
MPNIAPSFVIVHPSYIEPGLILPYSQASGAFNLLAGKGMQARLSDVDKYVYMKRIDIRNKVAAGQAAYNLLPSVSITMNMISTPTYQVRVRAEYDHHDTAAMGVWDVSIVEAQRLGMRQGHFQFGRNALLYGFNPAQGEGPVNSPGATAVNLPPDSSGNETVSTYDNGQMAFFLVSQIQSLKTRTNQLGIPHKFTILGPQRVLGTWEYQSIVQLVQYQREGAGTTSTAGVVKDILAMNGDEIEWAYDDTLIGAGAGGNDLIIINLSEIEKPKGASVMNTNEFAKLAPGIDACSIMYCDQAAPREISTPIPGGAIDVLSERKFTSGWQVRPEAITLISMQFE